MKILLFSNQGLAPLHLGIELEVIERLREEGNELYIVRCDNQLEGCYFNPCHNLLGCAICQARSDEAYKNIGLSDHQLYRLRDYAEPKNIELPFFADLESLLDYEFQGINIGRGVASSIVSLRRDDTINSATEGSLIEFQLRMAINVCLNFHEYINLLKPDVLYFFNGRFAECYPLIGLAKKYGILYRTMEVASSDQRYHVYQNSLPHSIATWSSLISDTWEKAPEQERIAIAQEWFESKRSGTVKTALVFTGRQSSGALPGGFDNSKTNVVIYNSSEDEMRVIEEWKHDLYISQNAAITQLAAHYRHRPEFHFYLRVHPNLDKLENAQVRGIGEMYHDNLTIIPADSQVDTYALMEACSKVLTFGSSTGIEATYWGRPSILYGKSFYQSLGCVYQPKNFGELCALIETADLTPKSRLSTYPFAHYISKNGRPYRFFNYRGKHNSTYRGKKMRRVYPRTIAYFIRYLGNLGKWVRYNKIVRGRSILRSNITKLR